MRIVPILSTIVIGLFATGCCSQYKRHGKTHTTPLNVSGPVTVSGPVNVTGPVTVSGPISGTGNTGNTGNSGVIVVATPPSNTATPPPISRVETTAPSGGNGIVATGSDANLELKTEDLTVDRRTVSNGSVRIRKYVVTEEKVIPVTLRREEFIVERVPASGAPTTPFGEASAVIDIPLTVETAVGVVTPRVTEVIRVKKTVEVDQREIKATLRTEKFEVTKQQ